MLYINDFFDVTFFFFLIHLLLTTEKKSVRYNYIEEGKKTDTDKKLHLAPMQDKKYELIRYQKPVSSFE